MARTGKILKDVLNNVEEILEKTVYIYQEVCEIKGYDIKHKVIFKDDKSFVYQLQVSKPPVTNIIKYRNININLEDQIISSLDGIFTHICKS